MRSDSPIHYSVVVPFYNEQENIPTLYMKITEVMDSIGEPYEMVFVDDGSKDNSYRVLSEISRARPSRQRCAPSAEISARRLP